MASSPLGEAYAFQETPEFLAQVEEIVGSVKRWDEIKSGLDLALSRDPTLGIQIQGTSLRAMPIITIPAMTVYYTVDVEARLVRLVEIAYI